MADIWLIILPRLPSEVSLDALQTAYSPTLTAILRDASNRTKESGRSTKLDVGIAFALAQGLDYAAVQKCLALSYELTCIICTNLNIDVQYDNDVDVRLFLFQDTFDESSDGAHHSGRGSLHILPSYGSIAHNNRSWTRLCFVHSERGEGMLREFVALRDSLWPHNQSKPEVVRLPGGLSVVDADKESVSQRSADLFPQHRSVAVGGTFDHLHAGHKLLLTMTILLCELQGPPDQIAKRCVTIGITGDELLKNKKYKEHLEDWHQRQASAKAFIDDFLQLSAPEDTIVDSQSAVSTEAGARKVTDIFKSGFKVRYAEIVDTYGPTIEDVEISALVISAETRSGGASVNTKRKEKGWPVLSIFEVQVLDGSESTSGQASIDGAEGFVNKLSSTEIRSRIHNKQT